VLEEEITQKQPEKVVVEKEINTTPEVVEEPEEGIIIRYINGVKTTVNTVVRVGIDFKERVTVGVKTYGFSGLIPFGVGIALQVFLSRIKNQIMRSVRRRFVSRMLPEIKIGNIYFTPFIDKARKTILLDGNFLAR